MKTEISLFATCYEFNGSLTSLLTLFTNSSRVFCFGSFSPPYNFGQVVSLIEKCDYSCGGRLLPYSHLDGRDAASRLI